ncbi:hypothetical protein [Spiroplasma sp. AdecLV25b]|uniref:hypothetical protein n=1 Tax=Spiroplasma sp. AdecLV25b TaxID=3027162 RepID=UPI0027E013C8|nr:hypothetical protein [Spiroplasma sp. AdecLV25b]
MNLISSEKIKQFIGIFKKLDDKISESDVEKERCMSLEVEIIQIIEQLFKFPNNLFELSFSIENKIQDSIKLGIEEIKPWNPQISDECKLCENNYSFDSKSDIKHIPKF